VKLRVVTAISLLVFCIALFLSIVASSDEMTACYWAGRNHRLYSISFERGSVWFEKMDNWPNPEFGWWEKDAINAGPVLWPDTVNPPTPWKSPAFGRRWGMGHAILHADGTTWYRRLNNVDERSFGPEGEYVDIWFPIWPLLVSSGILPALFIFRMIWLYRLCTTREAAGCCKKCGYDLLASPDRCPECGKTVQQ